MSVGQLTRKVKALRADLAGVVTALEFYADPSTYHACMFLFDSPTGGFDEDFDDGHLEYDRPMPGKRARQALAVLDGKEPTDG